MNDPDTTRTQASSSGNAPQPDDCEGVIRVDAAAIADAELGVVLPGTLVIQRAFDRSKILAAGTPTQIDALSLPEINHRFAFPDQLLLPGLINAHTHLDLTHIGVHPHEPDDGFVSWVDMIRANRHQEDAAIADAVLLGIDKLLAGGTTAVGDIAGAPAGRLTLAPYETLRNSPIAGVSYLEFFGIGSTKDRSLQRIESFIADEYDTVTAAAGSSNTRLGLQPHAPNTVDRSIYRRVAQLAQEHGIPLSTHLAETPEERAFIATALGPQRELLERLGVWDDSILDELGRSEHPVEHLREPLMIAPFLAAHVNDATDEAIEILAQTQTTVAYCPRASEYFGAEAHFGAHRYRDMLQAGVRVCLGTDSIVNLDTSDRISVLDEMRLLHRRDGTDAISLLAMGTLHATQSLCLDHRDFTLSSGSSPRGILSITIDPSSKDPWGSAMRSTAAPRWVLGPKSSIVEP